MNLTLRKRHLKTWIVLSILLPIGFVAAYLAIPATANGTIIPNEVNPTAFFQIIKTADHPTLLFNLRSNSEGERQAEIVLKQPLTTPSTLAYLSDGDIGSIQGKPLLGKLDNKTVYRFDLKDTNVPEDVRYLLLYDLVKKQIYETIKIEGSNL